MGGKPYKEIPKLYQVYYNFTNMIGMNKGIEKVGYIDRNNSYFEFSVETFGMGYPEQKMVY